MSKQKAGKLASCTELADGKLKKFPTVVENDEYFQVHFSTKEKK
jgi:hypothetical protein